MKKLLLILTFSVFVFSKILIVNSYDDKDQCGIPQLNGFLSEMYENGFSPKDFDIYFLNARVNSKPVLKKKASEILKNLNKYQYVVTFDDAAFQLVGIPASKKEKMVFFSGINIPFSTYQKKYHLNKQYFSGVYEKLYIKEVLDMFNKIRPINKVALFYSDGVGTFVKNQIVHETENSVYHKKIDLIYCKDIKTLIQKAKYVNSNKKYTLFIPMTLSIKKNAHDKIPFYKLKNIYLDNIIKPDISINMFFVRMGFLGFGGVDFFAMGQKLGEVTLEYFKSFKHQIVDAPKAYYFINAKRAQKINFQPPEWFMKKYVKEIIW